EVRYRGASGDKLGIGGEVSCGLRMLLSHVSKEGTSCARHMDCCVRRKFHYSRHVFAPNSYARHRVGKLVKFKVWDQFDNRGLILLELR
ncbi:hypothetical protein A2U01_0049661, partial [Trifolium medium]|nr:hypothetical protein [Trifolium medium]